MKGILGKLEFALEREVLSRAPRKLVFRYFTDSERFARWWGAGSTIAGRAGGAFKIVYPDGSTASGVAVSHTYAVAGSYTVTLKVTDDAGSFKVISQGVEVQ